MLFVGCSTDKGGGDFVYTGGGTGAAAPGALTFQFVKAQSPFTVPADTTQIRFQFFVGGVQIQQEIRDFAATITIDPVDARTTSVVITALGDGGFPIATATVPVDVISGETVVVDAAGINITPVTLDSILVTPPQAGIAVTETLQLTATLQFSNEEQLPADDVIWEATGQATVSATGLVTGVEDGEAIITATRGSLVGTANVVVGAGLVLNSVEIMPNVTPVVQTGVGMLQFTVQGFDQFNNPISITSPINWAITTNNSGSTIEADGTFSGGPDEGIDIVTVTVGVLFDTQTVNVIDIPGDITSVTTTPDPLNLTAPAQQELLTTVGTFENGPDAPLNNIDHGLTYAVDNTAVATVGATSGVVTAVTQGSANITSMANGQMDTVVVNVDFGAANQAPVISNLGGTIDLGNTHVPAFPTATVTDDQISFDGGTLTLSVSGTANDLLFDVEDPTIIGNVTGDGMSTVTVELDADATPATVQAFLQSVTVQSNTLVGGASMDISLADGATVERTGMGSRSASVIGFTEATDSPYTIGNFVSQVAVADFDGLNGPDIVATASNDRFVILLNDGDGTFTEGTDSPYLAGTNPTRVTVADFDGVNGPDLAIAYGNNGSVRVFLNDSDGTFTEGTDSPYTGFNTPQSIASGDFDGLNGPDIVVGANSGTGASILFNDGDGTFSPAVTLVGGSVINSLTVADFDGINGPDVAMGFQNFPNNLKVLLNDGDGTFTEAAGSPYATGFAAALTASDLDGSNGLDLAVTNSSNDTVSIFFNNGDGTFSAGGAPSVGDSPRGIAVGDFDGMRGPDLAVANRNDNNLTVLLNQGNGSFVAAAGPFATGTGPAGIAVADFDGVRGPDLVTANFNTTTITVLFNDYLP